MDLRSAVALSILPNVPRRLMAAAVREVEAELAGGSDRPTLDQICARLEQQDRVRSVPLRALETDADRLLERATALGISAVAWGSTAYPAALTSIVDPPLVLWLRGQSEVLHAAAVALVGSRTASHYGLVVAEGLGTALAERGVTVVSGLARGVDSAAHRGALSGGGATVAVLGSGVDVIYPPEHDRLADAICASGVIVSECPPGAPPLPSNFPLRNRIISGLALAVVVVEAADRSGSLITARCALEQGREVMAVPGNVLNGRHRGAHALLKDGAKVVEDVDDILEEVRLGERPSDRTAQRPHAPVDPLLELMSAGEVYDLDALVVRSGRSGPALLPRLLELELAGRVTRVAGGRFALAPGK